jgi:hypothetical protein
MIGVDICKSQHDYYCLTRTRLADFIQRYYNLSDVPLKEVGKKFISGFEAYLSTNTRGRGCTRPIATAPVRVHNKYSFGKLSGSCSLK